jgi:glycerol-3-phosphate dehydrogenase (NAD(P)+)
MFQTPQFHLRLTKGVEVLELSGAFKNIYAIGCGLATGLGFGANTQAALIVMAIEEMHQVGKALELSIEDTSKAATIGDVILSCTNAESRNFRFGTLLAAYDIEHCFSEIKSTIEGVNSLASLAHFEEKSGRTLPFARFISSVVTENNPATVKKQFEQFFMTQSV